MVEYGFRVVLRIFYKTAELCRGGDVLIQSEYDIQFQLPVATAMVAMLHVHPTVEPLLKTGDAMRVQHVPLGTAWETASELPINEYFDSFGNRCSRFFAPAGSVRLSGTNTIETEAELDPQGLDAKQAPVEELPPETLQFLLASRYCQVDQFNGISQDLFGHIPTG
jgi:hypothetical protein